MSIEWTAPRETMLLEVAEGRLDAAIAPGRLAPAGRHRCRADRRATLALLRAAGVTRPSPAGALAAWTRGRMSSSASATASRARQCRGGAGGLTGRSRAGCRISRSSRRCWRVGLAGDPARPAMADTLEPFGLDSRRVPFAIEPMPHVLLWSARAGQRSRSRLAAPEPAATGEKTLLQVRLTKASRASAQSGRWHRHMAQALARQGIMAKGKVVAPENAYAAPGMQHA